MRESDILHETPRGFWVCRDRDCYTVFRPAGTHSVSDTSGYPRTKDGLSMAIARADYLERNAK